MGKILLQSMEHIVHGEEKAFTSASEILLLQMQKRCQLSTMLAWVNQSYTARSGHIQAPWIDKLYMYDQHWIDFFFLRIELKF